jgi:hypothetical protein
MSIRSEIEIEIENRGIGNVRSQRSSRCWRSRPFNILQAGVLIELTRQCPSVLQLRRRLKGIIGSRWRRDEIRLTRYGLSRPWARLPGLNKASFPGSNRSRRKGRRSDRPDRRRYRG